MHGGLYCIGARDEYARGRMVGPWAMEDVADSMGS